MQLVAGPPASCRALSTRSHLGELERNYFIHLLLQRGSARLSSPGPLESMQAS